MFLKDLYVVSGHNIKEPGQYPAILTSRMVNNAYFNDERNDKRAEHCFGYQCTSLNTSEYVLQFIVNVSKPKGPVASYFCIPVRIAKRGSVMYEGINSVGFNKTFLIIFLLFAISSL